MPRFFCTVLPAVIGLLFWFEVEAAHAQPADTLVVLPEIEIEAARASETPATAAYAVTTLRRDAVDTALAPDASLEDLLRPVPGLWVNDRGHFALGERVSIRGMGSRASFGVRGIQALLDGVPLTLPDGQAVLDIVDPGFVTRAEVIRGPASRFWGNGSGGVLFLSTEPPPDAPRLRLGVRGGSYGFQRVAGQSTTRLGPHRLMVAASDVRRDGHRAHSDGRFSRALLHGDLDLGPRTRLRLAAALADQDVAHPGALTAAQVDADPTAADTRFANTNAGKESLQAQLSATLLRETPLGLVTATAYGLTRALDNPLPFAYIDLDRRVGGLRLMLQNDARAVRWSAGVDAGHQRDDRRNFDNDGGQPGSERALDQRETVRTLAAFVHASVPMGGRLRLALTLRADHLRFALDDRLLADGDDTGDRDFAAVSPAAGLSYDAGPVLLFASLSTAFETPTTTELVNRPGPLGGFNPDLDPQRVLGFEVGARGAMPSASLRFEAALFRLDVRDRLVPFQTEDGDGRTFFRNGGANTHDGLELALTWQPQPFLAVDAAYTGSRFVFDDAALRDNRLPGIPDHRLFTALRLTHRQWRGRLAIEAVGSYFADDANTAENAAYTVFDLDLGHAGLPLGAARLMPFVAVKNVFDRTYVGAVTINAFGGRFFDPAPGRTVEAGLSVSF